MQAMQNAPWLEASLLGVLGLLIGSFLNVVIYRLPKMLERQWAAECAELSGKPLADGERFDLMLPRSRCPHCEHPIAWFENLPILSYLWLQGRCSVCKTPISLRYPLVEAATSGLFVFCAWHWGISMQAAAWCIFSATLLALALIDWDTTLLPDDLTLPLVWLGLVAAALRWIPGDWKLRSGVRSPVISRCGRYIGVSKLLTGKEGMGYGDFKLFAALGAWFGWQALIPMILLASVIGAVVGIAMKFSSGLREGGYLPFGPFLSGAGLTALILGTDTMRASVGI